MKISGSGMRIDDSEIACDPCVFLKTEKFHAQRRITVLTPCEVLSSTTCEVNAVIPEAAGQGLDVIVRPQVKYQINSLFRIILDRVISGAIPHSEQAYLPSAMPEFLKLIVPGADGCKQNVINFGGMMCRAYVYAYVCLLCLLLLQNHYFLSRLLLNYLYTCCGMRVAKPLW